MTSEKRMRSWRAWCIVCKGVGPISGTHHSMRRIVASVKQQRYAGNDLYQVARIRITLDPEKGK